LTKYSISISSNSRTRRDLVAERLALLRDAERDPHPRRVDDVLEIDEHALRGLGSEVDLRGELLDRAHVGFEHQVEHAGLVQRPAAFGALVARDVVGAPSLLARAEALAQGVDEVGEVAGSGPHLGGHDQGRFQADDVVAQVDHVPPPEVAHRSLHRDPVRSVVVETRYASVDLARREDEAASLCERDDFFHELFAGNCQASITMCCTPLSLALSPAGRGELHCSHLVQEC
jgi:hypothetical protein